MRHLRPWLPVRASRPAVALSRFLIILLPVLFCSTAHAYLYDSFTGGPGYPNRVDDHVDSLFVSAPSALEFTKLGGPGVNPDDDMVGWYHGTAVAGIIMGNDPAQLGERGDLLRAAHHWR